MIGTHDEEPERQRAVLIETARGIEIRSRRRRHLYGVFKDGALEMKRGDEIVIVNVLDLSRTPTVH